MELDFWFNILGTSLTLDIFFILLVPLSLVANGFNLIALYVLEKESFNKSLFYSFMRVYVLNGIGLSFLIMTTFTYITKRIFDFTNSYPAAFYGCYIHVILTSSFYFNGSLLEICILIERVLYFLPVRYHQRFKSIGIYKLCVVFLFLSILVSTPFFFLANPDFIDVPLSETVIKRLYFTNVTPFSATLVGEILTLTVYVIRDILTFIIKIALNLYSIILVRKYFQNLKKEKLDFAQKISSMTPENNSGQNANNQSGIISKADTNQTYTAILMCIISLLEHFFFMFSYFMYFFKRISLANITYFLAFVAMSLKHIANFFLLYKFNHLFRSQIKRNPSLAHSKIETSVNK
jgi:hypothetical protein